MVRAYTPVSSDEDQGHVDLVVKVVKKAFIGIICHIHTLHSMQLNVSSAFDPSPWGGFNLEFSVLPKDMSRRWKAKLEFLCVMADFLHKVWKQLSQTKNDY